MNYYERYSPVYSATKGDWIGFWQRAAFSLPAWQDLLGITQANNTQQSLSAQMDYEQYLRSANERALRDWHKWVPNRDIKYPEFSYPGQIYRSNTSIARAGFDYDTASANYFGNVPYRSAGLYGIASRLSRTL